MDMYLVFFMSVVLFFALFFTVAAWANSEQGKSGVFHIPLLWHFHK